MTSSKTTSTTSCQTARRSASGLAEDAETILADIVDRTPRVIATLEEEALNIPAEVLDPILKGIETTVAQLD